MQDTLAKIRERIRQLSRMTVDNGCTEAEAMAAAEKALDLMRRHGLDPRDLDRESASLGAYGKRRSVVDQLWPMVARVCRCSVYSDRGGGYHLVYYGRPCDVAVAGYLHALLHRAVHRESAAFRVTVQYREYRTRRARNAAMKAFHGAMVWRLRLRLQELWWVRHQAAGDPAASVEAEDKYRERLWSEIVRQHPGAKVRTPKTITSPGRHFDGAMRHGLRAGGRVAIDPAMRGRGEDRPRLGTTAPR